MDKLKMHSLDGIASGNCPPGNQDRSQYGTESGQCGQHGSRKSGALSDRCPTL